MFVCVSTKGMPGTLGRHEDYVRFSATGVRGGR